MTDDVQVTGLRSVLDRGRGVFLCGVHNATDDRATSVQVRAFVQVSPVIYRLGLRVRRDS